MKQVKRTLFTVRVQRHDGIWETLPIECLLNEEDKVVGIVKYVGQEGEEVYEKEITATE